jgi:hypothetical protein
MDSRFNSSLCAAGRWTWRTVCAALAYLSYKGFVQVKWLVVKNAIRTGFTSSDGHSIHAFNNIASQFAANPSVVAALGFPIAAEALNDLTMVQSIKYIKIKI